MSDPRETSERSADAEESGSDGERLQSSLGGSGRDGSGSEQAPAEELAGADRELTTDSRAAGDPSTDLAEEEKDELVADQQDPDSDSAVGR